MSVKVPPHVADAARQARAHVSPMVAREAQRLGVDVSNVRATGSGGRVRMQDVRAAAGAARQANDAVAREAARMAVNLSSVKGSGPRGEVTVADVTAEANRLALNPRGHDPVVTASARLLAMQLDVDLSTVTGTGSGGQITDHDVKWRHGEDELDARYPLAASNRSRTTEPAPYAQAAERRYQDRQRLRPVTASGYAVDPWLDSENSAVAEDPEVLRLANQREVRLKFVTGSGPQGRITRADVDAAAQRQDRQRAIRQDEAYPEDPKPATPLPSFTASGLDPVVLHDVPEPVRRAVAAADTTQEAHRLVTVYGRMSDEDAQTALSKDRSVSVTYGGGGLPVHVTLPSV